MNNFKEKLKIKPINEETKQKAIQEYKEKQMEKYKQFYSNKEIQKYFHHIVAAIMIVENEYYEFHGINIPYRFKANQSTSDKLDEALEKAKISYNENNEIVVDSKPILDTFAMKVISRRRPPAFSSTDPEIRKLIEEKKKNQIFLEEMQEFKSHLIEDEYTKPENYVYKYECTKVDYYEKCKEILERLKEIADPKSTNLLASYEEKIIDIDKRLEFLNASRTNGDPEEMVEYEDLTEENINFFKILSEFENSVYNKSDLAILTKQFQSIFKDNDVFKKLGVALSSDIPKKEKRTENGFESNFFYLDTLFGPIECQLQTEDQYRSGNYGHAAHTKLKGKAIKPLPIPDVKDKEKVKQFVQEVNRISPKSFLARMDDNEPGRVMIQEFNDYQNYKNLISQVPKGDSLERFIRNYCAKLYSLRYEIFKSKENSLGFIKYDLNEYIESEEFQKLKKMANEDKQKANNKEDEKEATK